MSQGDNGVETHSPSIWGNINPLCRQFFEIQHLSQGNSSFFLSPGLQCLY